jgi:hypothetical protein
MSRDPRPRLPLDDDDDLDAIDRAIADCLARALFKTWRDLHPAGDDDAPDPPDEDRDGSAVVLVDDDDDRDDAPDDGDEPEAA